MAINRDIVETRKLASKGIRGDNMIGIVDGAPAHITAYESYLLGQPGGEEAVKSMGAGTINSETGLKQYHYKFWSDPANLHHNKNLQIGGWLGESWDKMVGKEGVLGNTGQLLTGQMNIGDWAGNIAEDVGDIWDYTLGVKGLGSMFGHEEAVKSRSQARGIVGQGMESLVAQQEREMGPEGFITVGQQLEEEGIEGAYGTTMEGISSARDKLISGANVAFSGESKAKIGKMTGLAETQYQSQIKESTLKADKAESDFMVGLRKQMNQLMMDYQSVSGEAYGGGSAYNELNTLFENYDNA